VATTFTPKQHGELAELAFMYECTERGLSVLTPFGDSAPYDVVVDTGKGFVKVQVKSTHSVQQTNGCSSYSVHVCHSNGRGKLKKYEAGVFDVLAATIIPEKVWYIIPANEVIHVACINLYAGLPHRGSKRSFEKYLGAWHFLEDKPQQEVTETCKTNSTKTSPETWSEKLLSDSVRGSNSAQWKSLLNY
jgi:hypothetical protein